MNPNYETEMFAEFPNDRMASSEEVRAAIDKMFSKPEMDRIFRELANEDTRVNLKDVFEPEPKCKVIPGDLVFRKLRRDRYDASVICKEGNQLKLFRLSNGELEGKVTLVYEPAVNGITGCDLADLVNHDPSFQVEDYNGELISVMDLFPKKERPIQVSTGDVIINSLTGIRYMIGAEKNYSKFLLNLETGKVETSVSPAVIDNVNIDEYVSLQEMKHLVDVIENYSLIME